MSGNTEPKPKYQEKPGGYFAKGNPGKPVGAKHMTTKLMEAISAVSEDGGTTEDQQIIKALVKKAKEGDIAGIKLILNYTDGMPLQGIEHSGPNGGAIAIDHRVIWE